MIGIAEHIISRLGVSNREEMRQLLIQFLKFGLVGVSNTLVSWACYYLFLWVDDDLYMVGSVVGTIVSIANAFFWNDKFVFRGNDYSWQGRLRRLGKTYISYGGTSLLSLVLLWAEVEVFHLNKTIAPIVNLLITIPLNFLINKFWTFHSDSGDKRNGPNPG